MSSQMSLDVLGSTGKHAAAKLTGLGWAAIAGGAFVFAYLIYLAYFAHATTGESHGHGHGHVPPLMACLPFAALLLCIAVLPLMSATAHWWENNQNRLLVSVSLSAVTLCYFGIADGLGSVSTILEHSLIHEYIPFIVLLFSLYVISGGICLQGDLPAHPRTNAAFLAVGAGLASFIGTTGASMLLIRPLLQTNKERKHVTHTVIFFIFLVSNIGGLLLPIGDPPLFLGYLRGVPFLWTLGMFLPWLVTTAIVLAVYFAVDCHFYRKEKKSDIQLDETRTTPLSLTGRFNFLYLLGIVFCVALLDPSKSFFGLFTPYPLTREVLMLVLVGLSLKTTAPSIRKINKFNYHAILEVAALFLGIFICMQVPIAILHAKGADLPLTEAWHFFWATGILSSFLDNAPTYVVFFETATVMPTTGEALTLAGGATISVSLLTAISLGSVLMGAMTYIGNGPNFMVKSIAQQSGVRMPSFFGYMLWSVVILVPIFLLVSLLFIV